MHLAALDTLAITKRLKSRGFTEDQAEAITEEIQGAQDGSLENLATKSDIKDIRTEIKAVETKLENKIESEVRRLENRMSEFEIRIGVTLKDIQLRMGALIVGLGAFLAAIKYFG